MEDYHEFEASLHYIVKFFLVALGYSVILYLKQENTNSIYICVCVKILTSVLSERCMK